MIAICVQEQLYEEDRLKRMKKDEADAEARRHHDYFVLVGIVHQTVILLCASKPS